MTTDGAVGDHAARDRSNLRGAEDLADLRGAHCLLLVDRLEHASQGGLDLIDGVVDDRVVPNVNVLLVSHTLGMGGRANVEAHDDGVGSGSQRDIGLGNGTDAAVNNAQVNLVAHIDLGQGILERLNRTSTVTLENEQQLLGLALLQLLKQLVKGLATRRPGLLGSTHAGLTLFSNLARLAVVVDNQEVVASAGYGGQPKNLHRGSRSSLVDALTLIIDHGAHTSIGGPGNDGIANMQGATLDQGGGHRTTPLIEVSLNGNALSGHIGIGTQIKGCVGSQHDRLEKIIETLMGTSRDIDEHRVAAVLLRH